ncbi:MAG: Flagellar hook protein FlgE [Pseudomonadota bacterium]|jgi:flagellar hook-basal body protein
MSFFTALTGLNAATAQLGVTSNNIANAGTIGFKRSRTDFGDIFATSPLQKATSTIGQGVSLKRVTQEFSQGNVSFSSNTLDLAITGDGFFPLKSADGFQDIYTRNGSFMMNDQYNVVNSAGQRLMAASVDSSGKANLSDLNVLTIPQKTTGQAKETTLVKLGLNFPADAQVISESFNRNNPNTYNKSTALTVYDKGGNGYLATVYYVKTQNASASQPTNKWQTYVYIGDSLVSASLQQATNDSNEKMYVNKYGQLKPESAVSDLLVNAKTKMFSLDDLSDVRTSVPASITGNSLASLYTNADTKIDFTDLSDAQKLSLTNFMEVSVDGSEPVNLNMTSLIGQQLTGSQIAKSLTNELNKQFGDERYFDLSSMVSSQPLTLVHDPDAEGVGTELNIDLSDLPTFTASFTSDNKVTDASKVQIGQLIYAMQQKIDAAVAAKVTAKALPADTVITVSYDPFTRGFKFKESDNTNMGIRSNVNSNSIFGLTTSLELLDADGGYSALVGPNGDFIRPLSEQRYGLKVEFDNVKQNFTISSGTTGDASTIKVTIPSMRTVDGVTTFYNDFSNLDAIPTNALEGYAKTLLGIANTVEVATKEEAIRGVESSPASITGSPVQINVNNNFTVDATNYKFVVAVDDVKGTVELPFGNTYTLDSFKAELEKRINQLANETGSTVSGVKVGFDRAKNSFTFTTGTASTNSFIKVSGSSTWGLSNLDAGRGATSTWIKPTQFTEIIDGVPVAKYIDEFGNETSSADGFKNLPEWSPIYLDKGELTFDTGGNLVSPQAGSQLDTVYLADGKGALTINIDYSKSTQFSSPYAVLSQAQDGAPEGDLVGVSIGDDGLVNASYSNGSQQSLGKVVLVNFSNPSGLRQIGDSSFYASSGSGVPKTGEAGSAGFGTVRSGATERANVDLTQELVDLITAQRNFQANAKAIETNTTLTQTIIQIRA